jgi:hypothetical protein
MYNLMYSFLSVKMNEFMSECCHVPGYNSGFLLGDPEDGGDILMA